MRKSIVAVFICTLTVFSNVFAQEFGFSDFHIGLLSYVPFKFFIEHELIKGYEDKTIRPDDSISRAEAIKLIKKAVFDFDENRMVFVPEIEQKAAAGPFPDVPIDHFAAAEIEWALKEKIIQGYEDKNSKINIFKPDKNINLAEGLKMIFEAERIKDKTINFEESIPNDMFADISGTEWFAKYVKKGKERFVFRFGFKNIIEPNQTLTRGYFVDILYRLIKTRDKNRMFGKATFYSDFFEGRGTSNGEKFTQNGFTAAHKTLPFGTIVRVTNLKNGQNVDVRINDRGPFNISLDLDLTSKAFGQIASTSEGIVPVQYDIVSKP